MLNQIQSKISNGEVDPFQWLNFVRPIKEWYNSRQMDFYINTELDKQFKSHNPDHGEGKSKIRVNSVIELILQDHLNGGSQHLDQSFRQFITRNVRMLLFADHDSSSSTICYCYHLLYTTPACLAKIRAERDLIFGTDLSSVSTAISKSPHLLNQLPYTSAIIKKTLRLFPPASNLRDGAPGVDLVDDDGTRYPTENTLV